MAICNFFLQGRCRFGDKCWNEHPRDGRHHGQSRYPQQPAGSTTWSTPTQKYVQPSSFSKSTTWTKGDNDKASFGSFPPPGDRNRNFQPSPSGFFSSQNKYSALASQDHAKDIRTDKEGSLLDDILQDLDSWESSGQWLFSVYCVSKEKCNLSGFTDLSPEEMRLECYASQNEGNIQNYVNSVQQLVSQWKRRVHEIMNMNPSSKSALLNELAKPTTDPAPTFGGLQTSVFGSSIPTATTFSFKPDSQNAAPNAGSSSSFPSAPAFGSKPTFGFGNTAAATASSFSFVKPGDSSVGASTFSGFGTSATAPSIGASSAFGGATVATGTTAATGVGSSGSATSLFGGASNSFGFGGLAGTTTSSGFGAKTTSVSDLFKPAAVSSAPVTSLFGQAGVAVSSTSLFGQAAGVVVSSTPSSTAVSTSTADSSSTSAEFTPRSELSADDLTQFESKTFALGKIPLLAPPADLVFI